MIRDWFKLCMCNRGSARTLKQTNRKDEKGRKGTHDVNRNKEADDMKQNEDNSIQTKSGPRLLLVYNLESQNLPGVSNQKEHG